MNDSVDESVNAKWFAQKSVPVVVSATSAYVGSPLICRSVSMYIFLSGACFIYTFRHDTFFTLFSHCHTHFSGQ